MATATRRLIMIINSNFKYFYFLLQFFFTFKVLIAHEISKHSSCETFRCDEKHYVDDDFLNTTVSLSCNIVLSENESEFKQYEIYWKYQFDTHSSPLNAIMLNESYGPFVHDYEAPKYSRLMVTILNKSYLTDYKIASTRDTRCSTTIQLRSKIRMLTFILSNEI